jgi:hypothetical protein
VARDPLQLAHDGAQIAGATGHLDRHQLLDGLAIADVVRRCGDVIHAIGEQHDLRPVPALAEFLDPAMQIPDHDIAAHHPLAIETQHDPQHAMRAGVLRPHVDHELVGIELVVARF